MNHDPSQSPPAEFPRSFLRGRRGLYEVQKAAAPDLMCSDEEFEREEHLLMRCYFSLKPFAGDDGGQIFLCRAQQKA